MLDSVQVNVLRISLMRFANVYYGDEIAAALQKCGMPLPQTGGQLGCKQIKRMAKRVHVCIIRLEECMGGVIPHDIIVECVAKLVDMLTVDVAGESQLPMSCPPLLCERFANAHMCVCACVRMCALLCVCACVKRQRTKEMGGEETRVTPLHCPSCDFD